MMPVKALFSHLLVLLDVPPGRYTESMPVNVGSGYALSYVTQ